MSAPVSNHAPAYQGMSAPEPESEVRVPALEVVTVNANALRELLVALSGPSHMIRELQMLRNTPVMKSLNMSPNCINVLLDEFNEQVCAHIALHGQ